MPRRRDRHSRGMRGPLSAPNPVTGRVMPRGRSSTRAEVFVDSLEAAVALIHDSCPGVLDDIEIGIEDVPGGLRPTTDRVPLASAIEASGARPARIVLYRRPLEHRASSRATLREVVHRTLVEQVAALTGRSPEEIDPGLDD